MTHVAAGDCERIRPGLVAQPANTVSSLAFVVAGVPLVRGARPITRAVGWAAVAAGLGSVAYHGPGTDLGRYAHDAGLLALLGLMALDDAERATGRHPPAAALAVVPVLAAVGAHPDLTEVAQPLAGALAVVAGVARSARAEAGRGPVPLGGLAILGAGALLHAVSRTGGPLCRPDRLLQPHAVWHVAAGRRRPPPPRPLRRPSPELGGLRRTFVPWIPPSSEGPVQHMEDLLQG